MKRTVLLLLGVCPLLAAAQSESPTAEVPIEISSPDRRITAEFFLDDGGVPTYRVTAGGTTVLEDSRLGLACAGADLTAGLELERAGAPREAEESYEILTAKRRENTYRYVEREIRLRSSDGVRLDIIFRASDDGIAFRYGIPEAVGDGDTVTINEEATTYNFPDATRAWLQPMSVAKTGWQSTNPSYEEYFAMDIAAGTPSTLGAGWVYPALFRHGDTWMLVSEAALRGDYCGTRLGHESPGGDYSVAFPDPRETMGEAPVNPTSEAPFTSPWRLVVIGSLKTIAESSLGIDLADPPAVDLAPTDVRPGQASWSWVLLKDDNTIYPVQKAFIDHAADMNWEYCLIDADWDRRIGYERIEELADYAAEKGVGIILWYNSAGPWNTAPYTPRDRMLTHESRIEEFTRLAEIGIKGLKIDFFGGDGQAVIRYYEAIMEDAAPFEFHLNFHGATLPRGWHRTYPHLMTVEAIKGMEFITFEQRNADQEPTHATLMPFTRNVFDPMDFTPMALAGIPNIARRTTSAFQLATAVLYTSGIQHMAETPEGMEKVPGYVKDFVRALPDVWDDIVFLDGYPGKHVALARKGDGRWYLCGINGSGEPIDLELDLSELGLPAGSRGRLISDGPEHNLSFVERTVEPGDNQTLEVTIKPNGGFVAVFDAE